MPDDLFIPNPVVEQWTTSRGSEAPYTYLVIPAKASLLTQIDSCLYTHSITDSAFISASRDLSNLLYDYLATIPEVQSLLLSGHVPCAYGTTSWGRIWPELSELLRTTKIGIAGFYMAKRAPNEQVASYSDLLAEAEYLLFIQDDLLDRVREKLGAPRISRPCD